MESVELFLLGVCVVAASQPSMDQGTCETLYLLNLVPYPDNRSDAGWDKGLELIPAGHLATKHINSNPDILPGYKLEVVDVRSEACSINLITEGVTEYHRHLFSIKPICVFGVVGLFCSTVTNSIAPIANHPSLGYVQMAASTSPLHRKNPNFPHTFHTISSSNIHNRAMLKLMDAFKWNRVNIVYGTVGFFFRSTALDFLELIKPLSGNNSALSVTQIPVDRSIPDLFDLLNENEGRIGYFTVTNSETAHVLCEAYHRNFLERYHFIFHDRTISQVLLTPVNCTNDQLKTALESVFLLEYKLENDEEAQLISNITMDEYYDEYHEELERFAEEVNMTLDRNNTYANSMYDQVWAFALAANRSLGEVSFFNGSIAAGNVGEIVQNRGIFTKNLIDVEFNGASGLIRFGAEKEVQSSVNIYQVVGGEKRLIGEFDPYNDSLKFKANFNRSAVPGDSFDTRYVLLPSWLGSLVLLYGIILVTLTLFNTTAILVLRSRPEIKSTSLYLSLVILVGCFFLLLSPVLLTIKSMFIITNTAAYLALCSLEFWFFLDGIIIIFLTLLLRMLRIFHVFRSHHSTGKYWSDKYLMLYITLMFSVMIILHVIQTVTDPYYLESRDTFISSTSDELPYKLTFYYCSSSSTSTWLVLSSVIILVAVTLVIFLAVQTRHIKKKHFKDTKKVNMFIFSVCINYAIFIPLWLILLQVSNTGAYICKCLANLQAAALCQVFLFLPKILPATQSSITQKREKSSIMDLMQRFMIRKNEDLHP